MTLAKIVFLGLIFVLIFGVAVLSILLFTRDPLKERLSALDERDARRVTSGRNWRERLVRLSEPLAKLSLPADGWETSPARLAFIHAGWREAATPGMFYAAKTALTLGLPLLAWLAFGHGVQRGTSPTLLYLLFSAAVGYYLPDLILKRRIATRQREIFESFPDALDLMTVCVEAGLGMDAALARVGAEIGLKSRVLAEELQLVTLELRAGSAKEKALRNLALRTGVEDVDALVKMLIQAERFGTSIGTALRVQSEQLRTRRRQLIEEQAAKVATKILFPLIFFIFPALLVVLLGPSVIQIMHSLTPLAGAAGNG